MLTVYKYNLATTDEQVVSMPVGARVLTVQVQHEAPCIWALVDPGAPTEDRRFSTRGTGHAVGEVGPYVGTYQLYNGELVFHVFEGSE